MISVNLVGSHLACWSSSDILPFFSFMPIHSGGETDLRFLYCAGKGVLILTLFVYCLKMTYL